MAAVPGLSDESEPLLPEDLSAILQFLPQFEHPDFSPGSVVAEEGHLPWFDYSRSVDEFVQALYKHKFIVMFDWGCWQDEAIEYYNDPERMANADLPTLRRILTLHVRKERFCAGHLEEMFESGHIVAVLRRLQDIAGTYG
ncbi:DUF6508 domain-containing protein [Methanocalculus sp.]|uniref:DUF6508 domain-containing protein n=1 Tax=Methanocalculus sp. TaxID=2004547 RepID=UPI00260DA2E3|nr:DUF6508 domain-containing protein [Methanocalculus sp.]MDG6251257.1 DUF6508 domain-containing protein [Methanocalculus sp.]